MENLRKRIGSNLKKCRLNAQLTQEQVAERAGISVPFYGNIESGNRLMSMETLIALANVLGVSTDCILLGEIENVHIENIGALLRDKPEPFIIKTEKPVRSIVDIFLDNEDGDA